MNKLSPKAKIIIPAVVLGLLVIAVVDITLSILVYSIFSKTPAITEISGEWKEVSAELTFGEPKPTGNTFVFSIQGDSCYVWKTGWPQCVKYSIHRSQNCINCYKFTLNPDDKYRNAFREFSTIVESEVTLDFEYPGCFTKLVPK
jgi:hypothetical protein